MRSFQFVRIDRNTFPRCTYKSVHWAAGHPKWRLSAGETWWDLMGFTPVLCRCRLMFEAVDLTNSRFEEFCCEVFKLLGDDIVDSPVGDEGWSAWSAVSRGWPWNVCIAMHLCRRARASSHSFCHTQWLPRHAGVGPQGAGTDWELNSTGHWSSLIITGLKSEAQADVGQKDACWPWVDLGLGSSWTVDHSPALCLCLARTVLSILSYSILYL
jgi:hypothetical protein